MMYEQVDTGVINDEDLPWVPFSRHNDGVFVKYVKCDPVRGEVITFLKAPARAALPRHHHTGTVIVYTIKGAWKYREHDWIARPGSVVYETASTEHTPEALTTHGDEIVTFNIVQGELLYLDAQDRVVAIENWKTGVKRYLDHCKANNIAPRDITSFNDR